MLKLIGIGVAGALMLSTATYIKGRFDGKEAYQTKVEKNLLATIEKNKKKIGELEEDLLVKQNENAMIRRNYGKKVRADGSLRNVVVPVELRLCEGPITSATIAGGIACSVPK